MLKTFSVAVAALFVTAGAPSALAMSAGECSKLSADLNKTKPELMRENNALVANAEALDRLGEEYDAAKNESTIPGSGYMERYLEIEAKFKSEQADHNARFAAFQQKASAFNDQQRLFQAGCKKYVK